MRAINTLVASVLLAISTLAQSAMVSQMGTNVTFTYDDSTLFGTGTVVGNAIFFNPTNFLAESNDGAGIATSTDTLNLNVVSQSGFLMSQYGLLETGDYRLNGAPGAQVDASAFLSVTSGITNCGLFACTMNNTFTAGPLADTGGALQTWQLSGLLDIGMMGPWGSDTDVTLQLQNNLLAESVASGDIAFIQKKQGQIGIAINPVPVPAAVWLFLTGLLGLVGVARRK